MRDKNRKPRVGLENKVVRNRLRSETLILAVAGFLASELFTLRGQCVGNRERRETRNAYDWIKGQNVG